MQADAPTGTTRTVVALGVVAALALSTSVVLAAPHDLSPGAPLLPVLLGLPCAAVAGAGVLNGILDGGSAHPVPWLLTALAGSSLAVVLAVAAPLSTDPSLDALRGLAIASGAVLAAVGVAGALLSNRRRPDAA